MHQPLFVQTSQGWVNLARVQYITLSEKRNGRDCIRFVFCEREDQLDWIKVPTKEGEKIIRALVNERPDLFLAA
jgi:hypothetical protein